MNKGLTFAAAVLTGGLAAPAQTLQEPNAVFQYFSTEAGPAMPLIAQKPVTGRPMAATESRHTLQVLADGTRIERSDTSKYYRDSEGRTRTESADGTRVNITDPSNGSTVEMNTAQHSARHTGMVRAFNFKSTGYYPKPGDYDRPANGRYQSRSSRTRGSARRSADPERPGLAHHRPPRRFRQRSE